MSDAVSGVRYGGLPAGDGPTGARRQRGASAAALEEMCDEVTQAPAADSGPDPNFDQDCRDPSVGTGASPVTGWLSASGSDVGSAGAAAARGVVA